MIRYLLLLLCIAFFFVSCGSPSDTDENVASSLPAKPLRFEQRQVVDSARYWWALSHGDINGDGIEDIVFIDGNNDASGYLGYKIGQLKDSIWQDVVIAKAPVSGGGFAAGDLEVADMDGDGDIDVLAVKHPGEWMNAASPSTIYWYENPGNASDAWLPHIIGEGKGAVKDMSIGDFNADGFADLAVMTFDEHNVRIHRHNTDGSFTMVADITEEGIHEGMDIGDLDGDGDLDVAANGYTYMNPGGDLTGHWDVASIDDRWYNQRVHKDSWSINATKTFIADIDNDGANEVFITHSENAGYPLAYYTRVSDGSWSPTIILDSIPAAHTLMVYDMDLDGDNDIVTGTNRGRAVNLDRGLTEFPLYVLLNTGDHKNFTLTTHETGGIYNGRVTDYDGDGDMDILRYPDHESRKLFMMVNQTRP